MTRLTAVFLPFVSWVSWVSWVSGAATASAQSEGDDEYTLYELLAPETASFRILYDVTAVTPGARYFFNPIRKGSEARDESVTDLATGAALKFEVVSRQAARDAGQASADLDLNIVRAGSKVSKPSARLLDTGEELKTETLRGEDIKKAGLDVEDVTAETEVVVISYPAVEKGQTRRLRIEETYTDPSRYGLDGDELVWRRSFGGTRQRRRPSRGLVRHPQLDPGNDLTRGRRPRPAFVPQPSPRLDRRLPESAETLGRGKARPRSTSR